MARTAWKQMERDAAALFGGRRYWANAGERLDFESDTAIGQCKLVKRLSLEALSALAEEMEREALPRQKVGVVVVKVRRGRGRASPLLVVVTAAMWEAVNGRATDTVEVPRRLTLNEGHGVTDTQDWIFTFGLGDEQHSKVFVRIRGTYESAREEMVRRFGRKWAFQYESEDEAGIRKWGLTELPLKP